MRRWTDQELIDALRHTKGMVYLAAKHLGCNHETISIRAKKSKAVAREMRTQRGEFVDNSELRFIAAVNRDEPWAIAMALRTLGKDRGYVEKTELDINDARKLVIIEEIVEPGKEYRADETPPGPSGVPVE